MKNLFNGFIKAGEQILEFFLDVFLDMSRGFRIKNKLD